MKLFETWGYLGTAALIIILAVAVVATEGPHALLTVRAGVGLLLVLWAIRNGLRNLTQQRIEKLNKGEK